MKIATFNPIYFGTQHLYNPEPNYGGSETVNLNHSTQFFRYDDADEFIINYLHGLNSKEPLNIISAGCSFGEEVYSYAMALDDLENEPKITGIDVSDKAIHDAKNGEYMLDDKERRMLEINCPLESKIPQTPYKDRLKRKFNKYFLSTNPQLQEYKKAEGAFKNCKFVCADLLDIDTMFQANSQDVILCRNVLYHLSNENKLKFLQHAYGILKPNGILCIEPFGHYEYDEILKEIGFVKPFPNSAKFMYLKPETEIQLHDLQKQLLLNKKPHFDDIQKCFEEDLFIHF